MNIAFWKLFSTSTICSTGFPLRHTIYIAISMFSLMFYSGVVAVNLKGGTECSLHISHDSDIFF